MRVLQGQRGNPAEMIRFAFNDFGGKFVGHTGQLGAVFTIGPVIVADGRGLQNTEIHTGCQHIGGVFFGIGHLAVPDKVALPVCFFGEGLDADIHLFISLRINGFGEIMRFCAQDMPVAVDSFF